MTTDATSRPDRKRTARIIGLITAILALAGALLRAEHIVGWGGRRLVIALVAAIVVCIGTLVLLIWQAPVRRLAAVVRGVIRALRGLARVERLITLWETLSPQVGQLAASVNELQAQCRAIERQLTRVIDTLGPAKLWQLSLAEPGPGQRRTLATIQRIVSQIEIGTAPGEDITDYELAETMRYLACEELVASESSEIRRLVALIRHDGYGLDDRQFPATKSALRRSAEAMLSNDKLPRQMVFHAYTEIMAHADQWPLGELKRVETKLKAMRRAPDFADLQRGNGFGIGTASALGASVDMAHHTRRLWKRVWAGQGRQWARVACWLGDGTTCESTGMLEEVSLGGGCCRTCVRPGDTALAEVRLELPSPGAETHVTVRASRAQWSPHGRFGESGNRVAPGMSFEFTEMSAEDLLKVGRFVRAQQELDPLAPPSHAPWMARTR